jgi:hypothetical protein
MQKLIIKLLLYIKHIKWRLLETRIQRGTIF